ncbi:accessory Sec system S-layer assembly protein [Peribacillus cavernae]|uniref:Accessory Sec system S-layer assembly protein n=1 Tax=Peribacillus cavernae TaxID=1674310 RepID=A0A3S0VNB8_9BACI|nr:accessory Sec system S-layer assembly protein [Peribacillus cavernae]MDQ0218445.1 accessory Sec system S-layer assembly protein [Peribacillus cavernae]RUQ31446.1 accessory Sec system S-layer assembly protein [Peribacillus cavernae]
MALFRRGKKDQQDPIAVTIEESVEQELTQAGVTTVLSFHPEWEEEPQERFVYQYHHQQLPKLKPNQISISGIKLIDYEEGFVVVAFLRNTLSKPIKFEAVDLFLLDDKGNPFAKRQFELDEIGEIPPFSCRPWRFLFEKEDKLTETIPVNDNWKIAFELQSHSSEDTTHNLDLESTWENKISPAQRQHLEQTVHNLPKLSHGEINFMGIEATFVQDGAFAVTILIRNGSNKNIQLEQIPLVVEDGDADIICQGGFQLNNFEVKANTSKPWTFIFPAELVQKPEPNMSRWKVYQPTQQ